MARQIVLPLWPEDSAAVCVCVHARACARVHVCNCTCVSQRDESRLPDSRLGRLPEQQRPSRHFSRSLKRGREKNSPTFHLHVVLRLWAPLSRLGATDDGEKGAGPRSPRHNASHCSAGIIRVDVELGPGAKRSRQPWTRTQVLGPEPWTGGGGSPANSAHRVVLSSRLRGNVFFLGQLSLLLPLVKTD